MLSRATRWPQDVIGGFFAKAGQRGDAARLLQAFSSSAIDGHLELLPEQP